jgi:alpha-L-fucosidase
MTLNSHWGYFLGDEKWKPSVTVIRNLVDIVSKGGNYLLNVGPTGQGIIPQGAVKDLQAVGTWMSVNGESIYGTTASSLAQPSWGRITQKGTTLYLHIFDWPDDGKLNVSGLAPASGNLTAYCLADKAPLVVMPGSQSDSVVINLPSKPLDPIDTVIVLKE